MSVYELILKRRTIRKFENKPIEQEKIYKMINAARLAPSGANMQPMKYIAVVSPELCRKVFPLTKYGGYLKDGNPKEGEEPAAYIVVLEDENIKKVATDEAGAAIENIILTALEDGIASCWVANVNREELKKVLGITIYSSLNPCDSHFCPLLFTSEADFMKVTNDVCIHLIVLDRYLSSI